MEASAPCFTVIKEFEGLRLIAYQDTGGVWTIGYGHTKGVKQGDVISTLQADELLVKDVQVAVDGVRSLKIDFTQNQLDALVSLVYNCGLTRFKKKRLYSMVQTNPYNSDIRAEWQKTCIKDATGKELKGLVRRRILESNLYCI